MTTTVDSPTSPRARPARPRSYARTAGLLAGAGALVAGELAGRLVPGGVSPVVAVGNRIVELTPDAPRRAGISAFGSLDKPLLIGGILVVVALLAAWCGRLSERSRTRAELVVAGLAVVVLAALLPDNGATLPGAVLTAVTVLLVGVALLRLLTSQAAPQRDSRRQAGVDRRHFFLRAGAVGVGAVAAGGLLKVLDRRAEVSAVRASLGLPTPVRLAPGDVRSASLGVRGISPVLTPNADFYRIDTALVVPQVDPRTFSLAVRGRVDRELALSYEQLLAMPQVEADITITCVSNEVGGDLVGTARWQGVLLRDVLAMAGVQPGATQVVGQSVDGFTAGFPTTVATDDRFAMIALGMNGEPLPIIHGFPARLIVPGLYGYVSATKWLKSITLTTLEEFDGFWIPRGWSKLGPIKIASRIDLPRSGSEVPAGPVTVGGMAWAPGLGRGVTAVEVRVDGGQWQPARLGGALSEDTWRQWTWTWPATPGLHLLEVRATDTTGEVQTERTAPVAPDGASGYHAVEVQVGA